MPARKVSVESTAAKPSLASLKPDKTKGDAAKKRAVKRLVATASKKSTPSRIKAIKDNLDVNTVPKIPSTKVKKATAREPEKKVTIKSTKSAARIAKKTIPERAPLPTPFPHSRRGLNDLSIKLPSNMSIRAREKALVILNAVLHDFDKPAERISLVSGLCFVVLGSYLALSFSGLLPGSGQAAQLLNTAGTTSQITTTDIVRQQSEILVVEEKPLFKALDQVPPELTANAQYTFSFTNVTNVAVFLYSLESGTKSSLNVEKLVEATYRYTIEASKLQPGGYVIKVVGESPISHTKHTYDLGTFRVPATTITSSVTEITTTQNQAETTTTDSTTSTENDPDIEETTEAQTTTETTNQITTTTTQAPVTIAAPKISLIAPAELKGQVSLKLYAPTETRFLELYARPTKSINSRYLGLAEKHTDGWYYFFNTLNQPNGEYELYGRTRINDTFIQSNSVNARIANPTSTILPSITTAEPKTVIEPTSTLEPAPTETSNTTPETEEEEISLTEAAIDIIATPVRTFSEATFATSSSTEEADPTVIAKADAIFTLHTDALRDILQRYAVAVQSGDEVMLRTAEGEFKAVKSSILNGVLEDSSLNTLADNISLEFDSRLEGLKKRIDTFEGLRRSAGTEDVTIDTDGDGISDFDENNLYRTDAREVDTDQDGFTDGIEIMRGFDPKNPAGEVAIAYELPQDTIGLEQAEVLKVDAVFPSIKQTGESRVVQSEIRGKALPNSYVTLYIFSTPTIVTVRTDDAGTFVYTFEKELEDGEHEVYAAVTDNSGSVIAHSKPFRFVKQAEAFTPVGGAAGGGGTLTLADLKQFELYKTVIGLGVLALGIVLLMLGFSLRHNRRDQLIVRDDIKVA